MDAPQLLSDLKNRKFKPVYLLHGDEPYYTDLISRYFENNILSEAEKGFNQTVLYGRDTDVTTILNAAKRFPMMSDYQLVLIKEAQDLKWGKEGDEDKKAQDPLVAYIERPLSSTILVFCNKSGKFDKRKKIYKAIEKTGLIFESGTIYESKIPAWIEDFLKQKSYKISPRAGALLAEYLGNDLSKIANELEKLTLNVDKGREINVEDIQNNIGISKEFNVFELQNAIAKKDALKAAQIISYFAANPKSNPLQLVLGNLNTYFTKILKYHYITDKSGPNVAIELGVNPFFVKDYELAARNYNLTKSFNIISYLRDCDVKSKGVDSTGNTEDYELVKEMIFKIIH